LAPSEALAALRTAAGAARPSGALYPECPQETSL